MKIKWEEGEKAGLSTSVMSEEFSKTSAAPGIVARKNGDPQGALSSAAKTITAEYDVPYLAHAMMEPLNCVVDLRTDSCELWTGTQFETVDRAAAANVAGLPPEKVKINTTLLGGGFGRRAKPRADVVHSHTGDCGEAFRDEVAHAGKRDPHQLRRKLLATEPRMLAVLDLVAQKAGWRKPLPRGVGRGIATHFSFETYVAQVVEASVEKNGNVKVHRVVCAVDCGRVINPDIVNAQMEGGIIFGLTAALKTEITLENGRVQQKNFHDYQMLRMLESPIIEVHIVPSDVSPTGVGEPGLPPVAPALTNAIFAATGKRVRSLPIRNADLAEANEAKS